MIQNAIDDSWDFDKYGKVIRRKRNPTKRRNFLVADSGELEVFGCYTIKVKFPDAKYGFWAEYLEDVRRIATPYNRPDRSQYIIYTPNS